MELQTENAEIEDMEVRTEAPLSESGAKSDDSQRNRNTVVPEDNCDLRCSDLSSKLGRILRLMKIIGAYYGNSLLDGDRREKSSGFCLRLYCAIVFFGQWTLVVQTVTSLFYEGLSDIPTFYLLLIFSIWYLQCAVVTTISLVILPKKKKRSSPFTRFTDNLLAAGTEFRGITIKSVNRLLALACSFAVVNSVCVVLLDVYGEVSVARFRPWDGLIQYRFLHVVFGAIDSCSWSIPFVLLCVSSSILTGLFQTLENKVLSNVPTSLNIGSLRCEYQKLCEIVALADNVFSPFLLAAVMFDIPVICINFHQLVKSPSSSRQQITFVLGVLYWCVSIAAKLAIIMKFGVRVNEKVRHGTLTCWYILCSMFILRLSITGILTISSKEMCLLVPSGYSDVSPYTLGSYAPVSFKLSPTALKSAFMTMHLSTLHLNNFQYFLSMFDYCYC